MTTPEARCMRTAGTSSEALAMLDERIASLRRKYDETRVVSIRKAIKISAAIRKLEKEREKLQPVGPFVEK